MEKKTKMMLILFIVIIGGIISCYFVVIMNTPTIEISNVHAEKSTTTWDYSSGKHEEASKISIEYNIDSIRGLDEGFVIQWIGYDKKGKVIFNETSEGGSPTVFDEEQMAINNLDKIVKLEFNVYKYDEDDYNELYGYYASLNSALNGEVLCHGETKDIVFTGETNHNVDDTPKPTQHRELTEREIIEMDAESYGQADYGEYYFGHDDDGNLKRYKKRSSFLTK